MKNLQAVTAREHFKLTYLSSNEKTRRQRRNWLGQGHVQRQGRLGLENKERKTTTNVSVYLITIRHYVHHFLIRPQKKGLVRLNVQWDMEWMSRVLDLVPTIHRKCFLLSWTIISHRILMMIKLNLTISTTVLQVIRPTIQSVHAEHLLCTLIAL